MKEEYEEPREDVLDEEEAIEETLERLHSYRNFRHRFVSGYGFQLKGEKMLELVDNIEPLWVDIKKAISDFWDKL